MIDAIEIANPSAFSISSLGPKGPWDEILKALGLAISIASINRFGKCYIFFLFFFLLKKFNNNEKVVVVSRKNIYELVFVRRRRRSIRELIYKDKDK